MIIQEELKRLQYRSYARSRGKLLKKTKSKNLTKANKAIKVMLLSPSKFSPIELFIHLGRNQYISEAQFRKLLDDLGSLKNFNYYILEKVIKNNLNIPSDLLTKMAYECTNADILYVISSHQNTSKEARIIAGLRGAKRPG